VSHKLGASRHRTILPAVMAGLDPAIQPGVQRAARPAAFSLRPLGDKWREAPDEGRGMEFAAYPHP